MSAIPVIVCGGRADIINAVIAGLKPEYEVIHVILTAESGEAEIPILLRGGAVTSDNHMGTHNYSRTPEAVLAGSGYSDEDVEHMRAACRQSGGRAVPWLRTDTSKPAPPLGPEYGMAMVERIKACLKEERGPQTEDQVIWY